MGNPSLIGRLMVKLAFLALLAAVHAVRLADALRRWL